jgi:hypothetical protein
MTDTAAPATAPANPFVADPDNPTDAELLAAVDRGIAAGTIITVDEDFLARLAADIDDDEQPVAHITCSDAPELGEPRITIYTCDDPNTGEVIEDAVHWGTSAYVRDELVNGAPIYTSGERARWHAAGDPREVEHGYFVVPVKRV